MHFAAKQYRKVSWVVSHDLGDVSRESGEERSETRTAVFAG